MIKVVLFESSLADRILVQSMFPHYCTVLSAQSLEEAEPLVISSAIDIVVYGPGTSLDEKKDLAASIDNSGRLIKIIEIIRRTTKLEYCCDPSEHDNFCVLEIPGQLPELSKCIDNFVNERINNLRPVYDNQINRAMTELVGSSDSIMKVKTDIINLGNAPGPVLITGESGTGKEIIAKLLHDMSERAAESFHAVNAGAIPSNLSMTELFGSTEGAYTGAVNRKGLFESSDRGSLFMDEIGDIDAAVQVELLRVLETGRIRKVGGSRFREVDVRLICATNKNLAEETDKGRFRRDLLYRIDMFRITVPPLRERKEDIPELLMHFSSQLKKERPNKEYEFSDSFVDKLFEHDWPGNVRELRNVFRRAVYQSDSEVLNEDSIRFGFEF